MNKLVIVALSVLVVVLASSVVFHGDIWQKRTANDKLNLVWQAITEDPSSNDWPSPLSLLVMFAESMNVSFDWANEDFPENQYVIWPYKGPFTREKLIHSVGAITQVVWQSNGKHNYTGLFQGAQNGLIRFSLATKPSASKAFSFVPGISLKFFRDYMPSSNFMAMYALTGQDSWNFFQHDLTNHVPDMGTDANFAQRELRNAFARASQWPTMLGLSDFAAYTEAGQKVDAPHFPFRLVFHPSAYYHFGFPSQAGLDMVQELERTLESGSLIYTIYAQDSPSSDDLTEIGTLVLNSTTTGTYFGDKSLFFQHVRMDTDLAMRPEWVPAAEQIIQYQQSQPQFHFEDLPWEKPIPNNKLTQ